MLKTLAVILPGNNPLPSDPVAATSKIIQTVTSTLITVAIIYFLIYFLLGGINFITSEGEKGTLEIAKKQLTYAFFGLMIVFSVFAIMKLIGLIFGYSGLVNLQIMIPGL